jgi:hypothetical protein
MLITLKVLFLFLAVLTTCLNTYKAMLKVGIGPAGLLSQAASITGFVTLQWLV